MVGLKKLLSAAGATALPEDAGARPNRAARRLRGRIARLNPEYTPAEVDAAAAAAATEKSPNRYVDAEELLEIIPVSAMSIWRWEKNLGFPKRKKFGEGRNARAFWWLPAVYEWSERRGGHAS